ncbi:MAG: hypothetical protein ACT4OJ_08835 [Bacteroidota bacterium]
MAKTVTQYYDQIKAEAINQATAAGNANLVAMFNNTSRVAVWKILFYAVAYGIFLIDSLFDLFRAETDLKIKQLKPATLTWFAEKIKTFQYGYNVVPETDYYDNTGLTEAQITASKVIKYAAATEQNFSNGRFGVRIKVAGEDGSGNRQKLPDIERDAAREFLKRFKPAGTYCELTTDDPDYLKLGLKVYYNPLVLDANGQRLDGTNTRPLQDAITNHLKNLPFNGRFNLTALVDAMQAVDGVSDPRITSAQTKYALLPYQAVNDEVIPDAGYLKIYNENTDLTIQWVPKSGV